MSDDYVVARLQVLVESLEVTADRCARQLLRRSELQAELSELSLELSSLLPTDSDGFRVFDRLRREHTMWWQGNYEYTQPPDCEHARFWLELLREVLATYLPTFLAPSPKDQVLLQAGDAFGAKSKVFALLKRAQTSLDIVDSYMDDEIFPYLESLPEALAVRLLTKDRKPIFRTLYEALHAKRAIVEARQSHQFHDRFIVLDGREVWHLGASLNGIGSATAMLSRITDSDEATKLVDEFEEEWRAATPIEST